MLAMPAPERFLYYDVLVSFLLQLVDLNLLYLDTGCTYAAHWRIYMADDPGPLQIKLPWWHARGHGAECYLENSGFYMPGECACEQPCQWQKHMRYQSHVGTTGTHGLHVHTAGQ
jgi:hypothetical protein